MAGILRRYNSQGIVGPRLDFGFYGHINLTGAAAVTGPFTVSLAGTQYNIDTSFEPYRREAFRHRSIPSQRESLNFDNIPGLGVLNTAGQWPRGSNDWSLGAGQQFLDKHKAVDNRFYQSQGVNVWTIGQASLLQDTQATPYWSMQGTLKTWVRPMTVGKWQYFLELDKITFVDTTATNVIYTVASPPSTGAGHYFYDITHNGQYIFVACGTNGIYYWPIGDHTTSPTHYITQAGGSPTSGQLGYTVTQVTWAADQLWASGQQYLYVFGATTAVPAANPSLNGGSPATWTSGNPITSANTIGQVVGANWVWTNIIEGNSQLYVGGYNQVGGLRSDGAIYRISQQINQTLVSSITTTTTTYMAPVKSLQLTPGEWPTRLFTYLNYVFIGTNLGVRMAETLNVYDPTATSTGDLKAGALVPNILQPVTFPVTDFTAQGRWVWFTWANYNGTATGLGRLDVTQFIDDLAPAYASDLMVTGQMGAYSEWAGAGSQTALSWDYVQNAPMIALCNPSAGTAGTYSQHPTRLVPSGTINSGWIDYGIPDYKAVISIESSVLVDQGQVNFSLSTDQGAGFISGFKVVSEQSDSDNTLGSVNYLSPVVRGLKYQVLMELVRDENQTIGPIVNLWLMKAIPATTSETTITPVLSLFRSEDVEGQIAFYEPYFEYFRLDSLRRSQTIVNYIEGPLSAQVLISGIDWLPEKRQDPESKGYNAVAVVTLTTINGFVYTPVPTHV